MSPNSDPPPDGAWTEPRIERLVSWFVARELPPPLRETLSNVAAAPALSRRSLQRAPGWVVPACLVPLLAGGWLISRLAPIDQSAPSLVAAPVVVEFESPGGPIAVEQLTYAGPTGTYRQRTEWRWTARSDFVPQDGIWVEWTAPELVIDIEPAEQGL
jgi:hypothetical protein